MLPSSWLANFLLPFKKTSALADFKFVAQDGIYPIKFLLLFLVQVLQKKIFKIKRADIVCRLWWMLKKHKCHEDQKMFFLLQPSMENIPEAKVSTDCTCALHHCTTPGGSSLRAFHPMMLPGGEQHRGPQKSSLTKIQYRYARPGSHPILSFYGSWYQLYQTSNPVKKNLQRKITLWSQNIKKNKEMEAWLPHLHFYLASVHQKSNSLFFI